MGSMDLKKTLFSTAVLGIWVIAVLMLGGCQNAISSPGTRAPSANVTATSAVEVRPVSAASTPAWPAPTPQASLEPSRNKLGRVSLASDGSPSQADSGAPRISADGRWIVFQAETNSQLVKGDNNGWTDIFVRDLSAKTTELASIASDGSVGNGSSEYPAISADGRFVAFWSQASNLVPDDNEQCGAGADTYNCPDVFVHDRQAGTIERVEAHNTRGLGQSFELSLSADGRYIAFQSLASDLVAGDTNDAADVFVYDREAGTTRRVSLASGGAQANSGSTSPNISADGRWVAFSSSASNLVAGDTNKVADIFVHDLQTGKTERVSLSSNGVQADGESVSPSISADGQWTAFSSNASNLVTSGTTQCDNPQFGPHNCYAIFIHDRETGRTERVSVASTGLPSDGDSFGPSISADGRYVAFTSFAGNLTSEGANQCPAYAVGNCPDVFVHDRQTGETKRISMAVDGKLSNGSSSGASVSGDGCSIAFSSEASNLVPGDSNGQRDVFVYDCRQ